MNRYNFVVLRDKEHVNIDVRIKWQKEITN